MQKANFNLFKNLELNFLKFNNRKLLTLKQLHRYQLLSVARYFVTPLHTEWGSLMIILLSTSWFQDTQIWSLTFLKRVFIPEWWELCWIVWGAAVCWQLVCHRWDLDLVTAHNVVLSTAHIWLIFNWACKYITILTLTDTRVAHTIVIFSRVCYPVTQCTWHRVTR